MSGSLVFRCQNDQPLDRGSPIWISLWHHERDWLVRHKCLCIMSQPFSALHWQNDWANQHGCTQRSSDWKQENYPCGWKNQHTRPANGICCLFCTFSGNKHLHSGYPLTKLQKNVYSVEGLVLLSGITAKETSFSKLGLSKAQGINIKTWNWGFWF